ncbi:MAG: sulfur oxidation c-type cytochrome SoxX, partial [Ramlibacter sp.]
MKIQRTSLIAAIGLAAVVAGCASLPGSTALPSSAELDRMAGDMAKASFRDQGLVKVDRLVQDQTNRECSAAPAAGTQLDPQRAKAI